MVEAKTDIGEMLDTKAEELLSKLSGTVNFAVSDTLRAVEEAPSTVEKLRRKNACLEKAYDTYKEKSAAYKEQIAELTDKLTGQSKNLAAQLTKKNAEIKELRRALEQLEKQQQQTWDLFQWAKADAHYWCSIVSPGSNPWDRPADPNLQEGQGGQPGSGHGHGQQQQQQLEPSHQQHPGHGPGQQRQNQQQLPRQQPRERKGGSHRHQKPKLSSQQHQGRGQRPAGAGTPAGQQQGPSQPRGEGRTSSLGAPSQGRADSGPPIKRPRRNLESPVRSPASSSEPAQAAGHSEDAVSLSAGVPYEYDDQA